MPGMDTSALIGPFLQVVGEVLADVKKQRLADIDIERLRLDRSTLAEKLEDFNKDLAANVKQEKGRAEQDMISRGLSNTTIRLNALASIDQQAVLPPENGTTRSHRLPAWKGPGSR